MPAYLELCVVDADPLGAAPAPVGPRRAARPRRRGLLHERPLAFAGRQWDLRVGADAERRARAARDRSAWLFAAVGLLSAAMLGASLLITTGRTRRIESAVRERTAALRAEVGERQVAEAALRASEQRFRNILDNVPIGVVYTDLRRPRHPGQSALLRADRLQRARAGGAAARPRCTHPEDVANDEALTAQLVARRDPDVPAPQALPRTAPATSSGCARRSRCCATRTTQPWRIVGVVEDITEHLRLEEAERAREAAEASNRAKSEFLSRMSHELRTPLNAMLGFAQLLEIDRAPSARRRRSGPGSAQIQQAGWHLLEMINDVLDLSRIESGNLRLQTATLELAGAGRGDDGAGRQRRRRSAASAISQDLGARHARRVLGDATRVKQILTNLLSNAVKYNVDGGRVHVASRLAGARRASRSRSPTPAWA